MAQFTRTEVYINMYKTGMIPVFYHPDASVSEKVLKACYEGGVRVFEFTNRGDFAHEQFAGLIRLTRISMPGMILGVGSVVDAPTAALYIQLGAEFIVSPVLNEEMARLCNRRKIPWVPGTASLSEISKAEELGAELVKIFPGKEIGGPGFIKAVLGPSPRSSIMPTGGVEPTAASLNEWFGAGAYCVGMGSQLIRKEYISNGEYQKISELCREALQHIAALRTK